MTTPTQVCSLGLSTSGKISLTIKQISAMSILSYPILSSHPARIGKDCYIEMYIDGWISTIIYNWAILLGTVRVIVYSRIFHETKI